MKKLIAFVTSLLLLGGTALGVGACGGKGGAPELKIGYTLYDPMNYEDENGDFVGFDTEFATKVCEELGYTPKFVEIVWDTKVVSLQTKEIDCIWNGMTITDELKEQILISDAYLENRQVVVVRAADRDKYATIADLANATSIAFEKGSAADSLISENASLENVTKNGFTAQRDTLLEVKSGRSDVAVLDITLAKSMTGEGTDYADLVWVDVGFEAEEYGIGFRKTDGELCEKINGLIAKYKTDGTFDSLYNKYMA